MSFKETMKKWFSRAFRTFLFGLRSRINRAILESQKRHQESDEEIKKEEEIGKKLEEEIQEAIDRKQKIKEEKKANSLLSDKEEV